MRPSLPISPRCPRQRRAFSLVELLVVIAVIAILVAIILPVTSAVRSRADGTQCLSNLRQIGVGISAYTSDHTGTLPGPLAETQGPTFTVGQPGSLAALLDPYLGSASSSGTSGATRYSTLFECPAAARLLQNPARPTYLMNDMPAVESTQPIWGFPGLNQEPLIMTAMLAWTWYDDNGDPLQLSNLWLIQDGDQDYVLNHQTGFDSTSDISNLLPEPAHVDHYNALFFDFHVESRVPSLMITQ